MDAKIARWPYDDRPRDERDAIRLLIERGVLVTEAEMGADGWSKMTIDPDGKARFASKAPSTRIRLVAHWSRWHTAEWQSEAMAPLDD